ncbi:serine/threonine-protein kinase Nek5-like [Anopheles ziemanni]|uniref:serine/threonine-protein kinase Nek5-like n=1 Tax=Anopheles coustani TaxID=139045 RepID=UPI00265A20C7|nr:serine/threonine-protein kinase Nek5-like [Anopheles coustani]XP_058178197.1 serine/threonine-protein kinase Nek5-like [Anopheles ziemanni]
MNYQFDSAALKLQALLAEGCFGSSVALYRYFNQLFVIKSVPYNSPEYAYQAVLKEHTILSQLNHPRIIQYFGYFQTATSWNIMLEFAERGNLATFIERRAAVGAFLNQHTITAKFGDIADGLIYLHCRNVIHRDLKPANVLICVDNRLKLADFGMSKIMHDDDLNRTIVGTPLYMAPEVARGKDYDYKSDVWALGIIFYELCMLEHPFMDCFAQGRKKKFRVPQIAYSQHGLSPEMQMLCDMMIQVDSKKRWTLENILKQQHVQQLLDRIK